MGGARSTGKCPRAPLEWMSNNECALTLSAEPLLLQVAREFGANCCTATNFVLVRQFPAPAQ